MDKKIIFWLAIFGCSLLACKEIYEQKVVNISTNDEATFATKLNHIFAAIPSKEYCKDSTAKAMHRSEYNENGEEKTLYKQKAEYFIFDTSITLGEMDAQEIEIVIKKGHFFDTNFVHMIIRHDNRTEVFASQITNPHFYHESISDIGYTNVIHSDLEISVVGDTIFDFNGDGYKDYALHLYSDRGCCPRDVFRVYLYLPHSAGFTSYYEFMNPTFFPKEKIIRGIAYGHPGELPLYEMMWDGVLLKPLRYIYPNWKDTSQYTFLEYKNRDDFPEFSIAKKLKQVPIEFKNIDGYEYFLSYEPEDFVERNKENGEK